MLVHARCLLSRRSAGVQGRHIASRATAHVALDILRYVYVGREPFQLNWANGPGDPRGGSRKLESLADSCTEVHIIREMANLPGVCSSALNNRHSLVEMIHRGSLGDR
jgi:hypothetical protein